jgi:hypothetical protein
MKADGDGAYGYSVVQLRGPVVTRWTPASQSLRAMGGDRFKESKEAVLNWVAQLLEVPAESLGA